MMSTPDTSYLPDVYRALLLEDNGRRDDIVKGRLVRFFRPGNRLSPEHPSYWIVNDDYEGYVGTILVYGSHEAKRLPLIGLLVPVRLEDRVCETVESLSSDRLVGSGFEDKTEMLRYLNEKYPALTTIDKVTIYTITYVGEVLTPAERNAVLGL